MRALVVYYTRTGNTEAVAKMISEKLGCTIDRIVDRKKRDGVIGLTGAVLNPRGKTTIDDVRCDPGDYDMIIMGTPVWWYTCTPAVRAYIDRYGERIRKAAFFYTCDVDNKITALADMEAALGKAPVATLGIDREDRKDLGTVKKIDGFVGKLRG